MIIKKIGLTNFRNYGRLDIEVGPSVNVIYGNNAQGKTNIIEAVELKSGYYTEKSEFNDKKISGRKLYHDGMLIPKISQYMGVCNTVIFAPEDLSIVKGQPAARRKYLNLLICKVSPSYYDMLGRTRKIIEQKNACLKTFKGRFDKSRENELEYWDFSIADLSAYLIIERFRYCERIIRLFLTAKRTSRSCIPL